MTRDEIMQLDDDALRLAVAKALGYRWYRYENVIRNEAYLALPSRTGIIPKGYVESAAPCDGDEVHAKIPDYPRDIAAAIALLDSMTYPPEPDGRVVSVEYNVFKWTYSHADNIDPLDKPQYIVFIGGRNPVNGKDYEATADTLPRAACVAWLMWDDARKEAQHDKG